ncbi:MAG: hypothetical protein UW68_C0015G0026 [Candidatus Collierbacteria bacterium GW2011_GWB1_44_6]|uniref:Uncharacterized protein n=1 Tax=Candidatus Collierbacteria bacterium GW2011_GWB1_44_6 TaxID=1618384 RepID=A0A0G1JPE7_9BACT|nr:MAG: hypothetical protein UW68_C0015G0026 [Candidatus Collierbacteria bacterium GW2011_GWB1_44_6]
MKQNINKISILHQPALFLLTISVSFKYLFVKGESVFATIQIALTLLYVTLSVSLLRKILRNRKNYTLISEEGLKIFHSRGIVNLNWEDFSLTSLQASGSTNILGDTKIIPYLNLVFTESGKSKISAINTNKSGGLYKKQIDFEGYMGEVSGDLYINLSKTTDRDASIVDTLSKHTTFVKHTKPIFKTVDPAQYNEFVIQNFEPQNQPIR